MSVKKVIVALRRRSFFAASGCRPRLLRGVKAALGRCTTSPTFMFAYAVPNRGGFRGRGGFNNNMRGGRGGGRGGGGRGGGGGGGPTVMTPSIRGGLANPMRGRLLGMNRGGGLMGRGGGRGGLPPMPAVLPPPNGIGGRGRGRGGGPTNLRGAAIGVRGRGGGAPMMNPRGGGVGTSLFACTLGFVRIYLPLVVILLPRMCSYSFVCSETSQNKDILFMCCGSAFVTATLRCPLQMQFVGNVMWLITFSYFTWFF